MLPSHAQSTMTLLFVSLRKQRIQRPRPAQLLWICSCPAFLQIKEVVRMRPASPLRQWAPFLCCLLTDFLLNPFPLVCKHAITHYFPLSQNTPPPLVPVPLYCRYCSISEIVHQCAARICTTCNTQLFSQRH